MPNFTYLLVSDVIVVMMILVVLVKFILRLSALIAFANVEINYIKLIIGLLSHISSISVTCRDNSGDWFYSLVLPGYVRHCDC